MAVPKPGGPIRGSKTGRPVMAALDLLGRRWTLRLLWELRGGPLTFRELRARCDEMSPTVLNQRLGELRDVHILESTDEGYALTNDGRGLMKALKPLLTWSEAWAAGQQSERKKNC